MNKANEDLIRNWYKTKEALNDLKTKELELRNLVIANVFSYNDADLKEGTENYDLEDKFKLKAKFSVNRKVENSNGEAFNLCTDLANNGKAGLAQNIFSWKPELSLKIYKNLDAEELQKVNEVIVTKSSLPQLEIVQSKK